MIIGFLNVKKRSNIAIRAEVIKDCDFGHKRRPSWIFRRLRTSDQMYHDRFELSILSKLCMFNPYSAGIDLSRQNLTSVDVRF